jgi:rubrerythrin
VVTLIQAFLILGIIGLFITYWKIAVGVFVVWLVGTICWGIAKGSLESKAKLEAEVSAIEQRVQKHLDMVQNAKTFPARYNNCTQALTLAKELQALDPRNQVAKNTEELLRKLQSLEKTLPISDLLEKAEKAEFKGQRKQTLNAYLDALFRCQKESVSDTDFVLADVRDRSSAEPITLEFLKQKARSFGWKDEIEETFPTQAASAGEEQPATTGQPLVECTNCGKSSPFGEFGVDDTNKGKCPQCGINVEFE